jgi:hypothetical protein
MLGTSPDLDALDDSLALPSPPLLDAFEGEPAAAW